ncbi:MAG: ParB/RepB/Spo0J family partition protein [Trebonia sp.]
MDSALSGSALGSPAVVSVKSLISADSPRSSGEDQEHVKLLAGVEAELPPIIVHRPTMKVIDGMHRLRAAMLRQQDKIAVRFFDGDQADAFVLAVKMNVSHGLPLSLADRKAAAVRIVKSRPEWSDRLIASTTGLAHKTVAEIRRQHSVEPISTGGVEGAGGEARIGRDGRMRPVDNAKGRTIAGELIQQQPNLSLRQVARMSGISPETARDVRSRINRGEQPIRRSAGSGHQGARHAGVSGNRASHAAQREFQSLDHLLQRFRADPSLRFSETGRMLLTLLQAHAVSEEIWRRIADNTPVHRREILARVARHCASNWQTLAERLERGIPSTALSLKRIRGAALLK